MNETVFNHPDIILAYHLATCTVLLQEADNPKDFNDIRAVGDVIAEKLAASQMEFTNGDLIEALKKLYLG